jgi:hypothetical protein
VGELRIWIARAGGGAEVVERRKIVRRQRDVERASASLSRSRRRAPTSGTMSAPFAST